eukprot:3824276-Amphidinium_carterae.1
MYKAECPPSTAQLFPEFDRYGRFTRCVTEGADGSQRWKCELGLYLNQNEFLTKALSVQHPFNNCALMHEYTRHAIDLHVNLGLQGVRSWR